MSTESPIDKKLVRRAFGRAAERYDAAAVLQHEVCRRMLSRLDYVKLQPQAILDAGCGTGNALTGLRERYSRSSLYALDFAYEMLGVSQARMPWWRRVLGKGVLPICGDIEKLPLRSDSVQMIWSNLALQWVVDLKQTFLEFKRVLAPGGLVMFSTFGPDTLKELRAAYKGVDGYAHVNRFVDMHDIGDLLVNAGFADPVMDAEYITLTYESVTALMRDLKQIGASSVTTGARTGMTARSTLASLTSNYEKMQRDGRLPATFEVVYGHAWLPMPRMVGGKPVIPIKVAP